MLVRIRPGRVDKIVCETVGTTAKTIAVNGRACRVLNSGDGIIYINPLEEVSAANGFQLIGKGSYLDLVVPGNLSVLGDQADRTVQVLIWRD